MTGSITISYVVLLQLALSAFIWDITRKIIDAKTGNTPRDKLEAIGTIIDGTTSRIADKTIELIPKLRFVKNEFNPNTSNIPNPIAQAINIQRDVSEQSSLILTHVEHNQRNIDIIMDHLKITNGNEPTESTTDENNVSIQ